jgi:BirA family biotin operon repressor/biotin-[acetyl-CoA-carboxylase] ligase
MVQNNPEPLWRGAMRSNPDLPPMFDLHPLPGVAQVRAEARRFAQSGGAAGTFIWAPDAAQFHACLILAPEEPPRTAALSLYLGMLALGDAVGTLIPPGIDLTFLWPNQLNLNAARVGAVELDLPPNANAMGGEAPEWLLLSFALAINAAGADLDLHTTTLEDEGCPHIESAALLETLARHALVWSNRWRDDGFPPVRAAWAARVAAETELVPLETGTGRFLELDEMGDLVVETEAGPRTLPLLERLEEGLKA